MRAVVLPASGNLEDVHVTQVPDPEPGSEDVVVAVALAGLNPADLLQLAGRHPVPPGVPRHVPGLEVAGEVVALGSRATRWSLGDRVMGIVGGAGLATLVAVHERHLVAVPPALADHAAAATPEAFVTAHDAVFTIGGLRPGGTLLVDGANGGVGTAGVQLGVAAGATVLARVRGGAAAPAGAAVAALGATLVEEDDAREVDVVLELVGAPRVPWAVSTLREHGRVVVVGTGAGAELTLSLRELMSRRASVHGTSLRGRSWEDKALATRAFEREVLPLLASGAVRPLVDRTFPAQDVVAAYRYLQAPGKIGKVLLDLR